MVCPLEFICAGYSERKEVCNNPNKWKMCIHYKKQHISQNGINYFGDAPYTKGI